MVMGQSMIGEYATSGNRLYQPFQIISNLKIVTKYTRYSRDISTYDVLKVKIATVDYFQLQKPN